MENGDLASRWPPPSRSTTKFAAVFLSNSIVLPSLRPLLNYVLLTPPFLLSPHPSPSLLPFPLNPLILLSHPLFVFLPTFYSRPYSSPLSTAICPTSSHHSTSIALPLIPFLLTPVSPSSFLSSPFAILILFL